MKLVSIVTPVYNRETVISEMINSVIAQSYTHWELMLVDDGSTDNTRELLQDWAKKDARIKVLFRECYYKVKGAPVSRNLGVEKATGDYIMYLDSDDLLADYCLEQRLNGFKEGSNLDFVVALGAFFSETPDKATNYWNLFTEEPDLKRFLRGDVSWQTSGPLYTKSFLLKNNIGFKEDLPSGQDWQIALDVLMLNPNYTKIDRIDYYVRRSDKINHISSNHLNFDALSVKHRYLESKSFSRAQKRQLQIFLVRELFGVIFKSKSGLEPGFVPEKLLETNHRYFIEMISKLYKNNNRLVLRLVKRIYDMFYPETFIKYKSAYRSKLNNVD